MERLAIPQFGTRRFLPAHVDMFAGRALARGEALGAIAVVQTTGYPRSVRPIVALARELGLALPQPRLRAALQPEEA